MSESGNLEQFRTNLEQKKPLWNGVYDNKRQVCTNVNSGGRELYLYIIYILIIIYIQYINNLRHLRQDFSSFFRFLLFFTVFFDYREIVVVNVVY